MSRNEYTRPHRNRPRDCNDEHNKRKQALGSTPASSTQTLHKKVVSKWISLQCRMQRRQVLMQSSNSQPIELLEPCKVTSMLSDEARNNLPAIPVRMSFGFLGFDQSTDILAQAVQPATLQSPKALREVFLRTFGHVLRSWGIQEECEIHGFEVSYPNGLVHQGGTVTSGQKVIVRTGTPLTEWLDQWSYLLGIAPHTSPPTIVAKLVKDDGEPLDPLWHTEIETSTWLELNDSIEAVRAESLNIRSDGEVPGEVPGEDHRDTNMFDDRQNMIRPTKKAKKDKYKGLVQKQRKQRRAQRETDALAQDISQAIENMDIRDAPMTFPTTFSTNLSTRSNSLPEGLLTSRSCAGRPSSACSAPDKDMEDAEML
ncbi:hypothetical protein LTR70_002338 [Exophiala xenobiotica]|nr:hypothetical protein LTR70_002338 [Exophiala xenobiotica]